MMNKSLIVIAFTVITYLFPRSVVAYDPRADQMRLVLEKYESPMVGYEQVLIATAEKYGLDWTLMAAIAGTESSFGKRMPYQCTNPYGWGIYGSNKLCFQDFAAAAETVASGLAKKYNISSLESIGRTYNKVSTEGWITHTRFFMNKIKNQSVPISALPITI